MRPVSRSPLRLTSRTPWARPASRTNRIGSRGVPSPTFTSGQTGAHSTSLPSVSNQVESRLYPPSCRTVSPRRQLDIPMRSGTPSVIFVPIQARP